MGRFINADGLVSTGQGFLSQNMFAYCRNNPANYVDPSGKIPWAVIGIIAVCVVGVIGADHLLAANQPEDGYAMLNETNEKGSTKRGMYAKGNGFELDKNGVTACDTEVGLASISLGNEYVQAEVVDCFTGSATAELDWSGIPSLDVSAVFSIYSPSIECTIPLGNASLTLSGELLIGAIGVGIEVDPESGKFKITPPTVGIGWSGGIDWDLSP